MRINKNKKKKYFPICIDLFEKYDYLLKPACTQFCSGLGLPLSFNQPTTFSGKRKEKKIPNLQVVVDSTAQAMFLRFKFTSLANHSKVGEETE